MKHADRVAYLQARIAEVRSECARLDWQERVRLARLNTRSREDGSVIRGSFREWSDEFPEVRVSG